MSKYNGFVLTPSALIKIARARRAGIKMPVRAFVASRRVGVPYWAACAFLVQETAGGMNVFGHDPGNFSGAGVVTKTKYLEYKRRRETGYGMQGVGPMQLTWYSFQDQADALGGCWNPYYNMMVGFGIIKGYLGQGMPYHEAARRYNGSGPAAEAYAYKMDLRFEQWKQILFP